MTTSNEIIDKNVKDRSERISEIKSWLNAQERQPDPSELERLADYILREELTDSHPDKVTREEYPILSETQLSRRHAKEASEKLVEEYGTDGKSYRQPVRKKRTKHDYARIDKAAKSRNERRLRAYKAFVNGKDSYEYDGETVGVRFIAKRVPINN